MADIDDQALAVEDGVVLAGEVGDVAAAHGLQVDVADVALAEFLDHLAALEPPVRPALLALGAGVDWLDDGLAGLGAGGIDAGAVVVDENLSVCPAAEEFGGVEGRDRGHAIDAGNDVAGLEVEAGRGEGGVVVGLVGVGLPDGVDAEPAFVVGLGIDARDECAEGRGLDLLSAGANIAADDEVVQGGEFSDHLGEDVGEVGARGDAVDERGVLGLDGGPVDAVHAAIVEVIAVQAPGLVVHLSPLIARAERELPAGEVDGGLAEVLGLACACVDDVDGVFSLDEQGLAVGGEFVVGDVAGEGLGLPLALSECGLVDGEGDKRGLGAHFGGGGEHEEGFVVDREPPVVAGWHGRGVDAIGEPGKIDLDRLGFFGLFLFVGVFLVGFVRLCCGLGVGTLGIHTATRGGVARLFFPVGLFFLLGIVLLLLLGLQARRARRRASGCPA